MKKYLSVFLSLALCLSLMPAAFAASTVEVRLGENQNMTFTISDVLDQRTMVLNVLKYDYETYDYVPTTQTFTLYQIPYTGALLELTIHDDDEAYPGGDDFYRLQDGVYGPSEAGESFYGQLFSNIESDAYWSYMLNFSEEGLEATDIVGFCITFEDDPFFFTCGDLDEIAAIAGVNEADAPEANNPFTDVPADAYYHDAVLWAYENSITTGTSDTTFGPKDTCTRGQVVTFLWRAKGCPEPTSKNNPFTDVKETDYFYKAVLWAVEQGITNGVTATTFGPKDTCSSGHIVTFLWRANGKPAATGNSALAEANPGQWYTDAIAWADTAGLLSSSDVAFAPKNNSPRADVVTYLYLDLAN